MASSLIVYVKGWLFLGSLVCDSGVCPLFSKCVLIPGNGCHCIDSEEPCFKGVSC